MSRGPISDIKIFIYRHVLQAMAHACIIWYSLENTQSLHVGTWQLISFQWCVIVSERYKRKEYYILDIVCDEFEVTHMFSPVCSMRNSPDGGEQSGPTFHLLLWVRSEYAQPITARVTEVTCPVIGRAQPELILSKRRKTGPGPTEKHEKSQVRNT